MRLGLLDFFFDPDCPLRAVAAPHCESSVPRKTQRFRGGGPPAAPWREEPALQV